MKTGLPVEEHDVPVDHVPLHQVAGPQLGRHVLPVAVTQELPDAALGAARHEVCPGVLVGAVNDERAEEVQVVAGDLLRVGEDLGDVVGNTDLDYRLAGSRQTWKKSGSWDPGSLFFYPPHTLLDQ